MPTPATVEVWESNGTSGAEVHTKITSFNFGSADAPNLVAANFPLVIPTSGTVYSYSKFTRWKLISWVDTNTVDTLRWYKSAGSVAGSWTELYDASTGESYTTPERTNAQVGAANWPTTTGSASAKTGTISNPTTGYINATKYAVHSVSVTPSAVAGPKGSHTVSWVYNES